MPEPELTLRRVVRRHLARKAALSEIEAERDEAIRTAFANGMTRPEISKITGLTPQRIDQIRRHSRV